MKLILTKIETKEIVLETSGMGITQPKFVASVELSFYLL